MSSKARKKQDDNAKVSSNGVDVPVEESVQIDYKDPTFMLKNINYASKFEPDPPSFFSSARSNMMEIMCDQVCFHVMCAFRAHHLASSSLTLSLEERLQIKPPGILVYGSGVVAEVILEALADLGCAPYIKVFARDVAGAKFWAKKGYRSTIEMRDGYQISILLICCNLVGFSQLCRDLSQYLTAKTFIISNVFNLQRKRMYNLFGTPGIVRTFVERKGATKQKVDREHLSTRAFSARQLASKVDGVKNLILILENYMIALDIHKDIARREAIHLVVGTGRISLVDNLMNNPFKDRKPISYSDEEEETSEEEEEDFEDDDTESEGSQTETDGRAKEVELNLNPVPLTAEETRKRMFEIKLRSFQYEDAKREEEERLEKRKKRKEKRLAEKLKKEKEQNKLNHDVYERIKAAQGGYDSPLTVNVEEVKEHEEIRPVPPEEQLNETDTTVSSPPHIRVARTSSPLLASHKRGGGSEGRMTQSSPSSGNMSPAHATLARFRAANEAIDGSHSPTHGRKKSNSGHIGFVGGKVLKKHKHHDDGHAQRGQLLSSQSKKERDEKREKEEREEKEAKEELEAKELRDKVIGLHDRKEGGVGFLQQMVDAIVVQPKTEFLIRKSPLLKIISRIDKRYGVIFREELAKHIKVMDLPSLDGVIQKTPRRKARRTLFMNSILAERATLAKRNMLLAVMPTVTKKKVGYLSPDALLDIFNSDKKTANLADDLSPLLVKIDAESDDEDKDGEGDDLFLEDVPRDKFRYFVMEEEYDFNLQEESEEESDDSSSDEDDVRINRMTSAEKIQDI